MKVFPTNDVYFELMEELVSRLTRAATLLNEALDDPRDEAEIAGEWRLGRSAEEILIDIHARLEASSVAPFDRGDIHGISSQIDAAISLVEGAAGAVAGYSAGETDPVALRLSAIALRATEVLRGAVAEMRSPRRLLRRIADDLRPLQDAADGVYDAAVESLFVGQPDTMHALRRKTLYDLLQATVRICQETGGMLERIAIKGS